MKGERHYFFGLSTITGESFIKYEKNEELYEDGNT